MNTSPRESVMEAEMGEDGNSVLEQIIKMKEQRLKILQEFNKEYENEINEIYEVEKKKKSPKNAKRKSVFQEKIPLRRSERIKSPCVKSVDIVDEDLFYEKIINKPEKMYGHIPGIEIGHVWETRMQCSHDGVHRPTVAGIHPGPEGAYSIALSGGYPEDIDEGDKVTFTGAGGRDLKGTATKPKNLRTAPQTRDQDLNSANLSLIRSIKTGKPVRVIRGYKLNSFFAPETGYRYDGLYKVISSDLTFGQTGFRVFRFEMTRIKDQPPAPWETREGVFNNRKNGKRDSKPLSDKTSQINNCSNFEISDESEEEEEEEDLLEFKTESELDLEIQECIEKLCLSSSLQSREENFKTGSGEQSFRGWD